MSRPLLLDLFCKAGGCSVGYHRAGFDVVGVDIEPQPRYPLPFVRMDAIECLRVLCNGGSITASDGREYFLRDFAAVHASPPCQNDSVTSSMPWTRAAKGEIAQLIEPTRSALSIMGLPFVIENVIGAPLCQPIQLCGLFFGLKVFRHRLFESSEFLMQPPHLGHGSLRVGVGGMVCACGHGDAGRGRIPADHRSKASWQRAMGINWMTMGEMAEAIPPAYTEFVGRQLLQYLET